MRARILILGVASCFGLLLIGGGIFAIKSHLSGADTGPADQSSPSTSPTAKSTDHSNPLGAINPLGVSNTSLANDVDPTTEGYTLLASAGAGRTIFAPKPDATDASSAVLATLRDLTHILDSKPSVQGAFADAQEHRRGGATFTGTLNGQPIKGTIMCGVGDKGAAVTVIYDGADAPASEWATLTAALPIDNRLKEQTFGDGAGTISLPADWKIISSSNIGAVFVKGPADQEVNLGLGLEIIAPDSPGAAMQNQLRASGQLTPATMMLVAPYTGPAEALKNLTPQLSDMSQSRGGPAMSLDEILQTEPISAQLPNGQAARINYKSTLSQNGQDKHLRTWADVECYPVGNGTWGLLCSAATGPDATFDADMPIMLAIAKSWKLNDSVVLAHSDQNINASNQRFAAFEQTVKEKNDAFDGYLKSIQHNELITERSNADFDEVIRGYRTVADTQTGERTSVNLGNVNEIVNSLNERDPGRYIQIPLRDEEFPLPGPNQ